MNSARPALFGLLGLGMAVALSSCAVGPDFETPAPPPAERFTREPTASPGNGQRFHEGVEVSDRWWMEFRSPRLNDLIDDALQRNTTIEAAVAAMAVAHYNAEAGVGALFPLVGLASNSSYNLYSGNATNSTVTQTPFSYYNKQVQISYTLDVWGGARRNIESLDAQAENAASLMAAAQVMIAANVAKAAIEEASLRAQIAATRLVIGHRGGKARAAAASIRQRRRVLDRPAVAGNRVGPGAPASSRAGELAGATARPAHRARRPLASGRGRRNLCAVAVLSTARSSRQPAGAARRAAARHPGGGSQSPFGERPGRRRHRRPPAEHPAKPGGPDRRLLYPGALSPRDLRLSARRQHRANRLRRIYAAKQAEGCGGRARSGQGAIPRHGREGVPERRGFAARLASRTPAPSPPHALRKAPQSAISTRSASNKNSAASRSSSSWTRSALI